MTKHSPAYDPFECGADDSLLRRYLLRDLGLEDVQEVERRIFFEDGFFQRADMVETELVEEYVRGALSEPERRKFESHYLSTAERRNQVQLTRDLAALGPRKSAAPSAWVQLEPRATRRGSRRAGAWPWAAVAAAAAVVFAAGVWRSSNGPSKATPDYLGAKGAGAVQSSAPTIADRDLTVDGQGAGGMATLVVPGPASPVRVRWKPASQLMGDKYPATVETATGTQVWSGEAFRLPSGEQAITMPGGTIEPGLYRIRLQTLAEIGHDTIIEFEAVP